MQTPDKASEIEHWRCHLRLLQSAFGYFSAQKDETGEPKPGRTAGSRSYAELIADMESAALLATANLKRLTAGPLGV